MKKVITYGSFDLFHEGHYNLLKRAKELGDYLIVGVTTEQYDHYRGKMNVVDPLMQRIENIKETGLADEIIIEDHPGQKVEDIQKYNISIFTVGSDWKGQFEYLRNYCDVIYLERTRGISSTVMREKKFNIIKLGIIGTGRIAHRFVPEAKYISGVNIEGVYNPNIESARKFCEYFELKFYSNNMEEFLNKIDSVYIASPHNTHYSYVKYALLHKKHVLCEKPLTFTKNQAIELYDLAKKNECILMEAIKTAYIPGFRQLLSIARNGNIGKIKDVEACFTKLVPETSREMDPKQVGGSFTELASYPLMAIIKVMGTDYRKVRFDTYVNKEGIDVYTKAYIYYDNAVCMAKVGLGVKSEGDLVIAGTQGYLYVEAPWWKTQMFEIRKEYFGENEKFYSKFLGEGLRYEISDFISLINRRQTSNYKLTEDESIAIASIIEEFLTGKNVIKFKE